MRNDLLPGAGNSASQPRSGASPSRNGQPEQVRPSVADQRHTEAPDAELAPVDDAIIGRAFRYSAWAMACLGFLGAGLYWWLHRKPVAPPAKITPIAAPAAAHPAPAQMPRVRFTEITREAGITFVHHNGAYGDKLLPETMGGGVAFLDYDNDQDQDLLFINSTDWPWRTPPANPPTMALYRNDGRGHFEDVTAGSGLDVTFYGMGVAAADYDADGRVDLFITGVGGNRLFHSEGAGKFRDVTAAAGVGGATNDWSTACVWLDYDRDGDLDLFVGHYVRWSREIDFEVGYKLVGVGRAYGQPMNFEGTLPRLYRNDGTGGFADVAATAGLHVLNPATRVPAAKTLGVAPLDLDGDGWMDLVIANDTVQNFVFHNQRNGTFKEIGAHTGIAFDSYGNTRGAMGIDAAYYRNDNTLGIIIGNFANEMTALYTARDRALLFTDDAIAEGIGPASRRLLKFGIFFFDYDLDGCLDVLSANGHLEEEIHKIQESQQYAQPAQLFWNCGPAASAAFAEVVPGQSPGDLFKPMVGRGSAYADIDADGDLDVVLTQVHGSPLLLRNDQAMGRHWLRLKLVGKGANPDAIGAWIEARAGTEILRRQVMPTRGYLSQSELPVTLGLSESGRLDALAITWPDGTRQELPIPPADTSLVVRQP